MRGDLKISSSPGLSRRGALGPARAGALRWPQRRQVVGGAPSLSASDEGGAGRGYFLPFFEYCLDPAQRLQVLARVIFD